MPPHIMLHILTGSVAVLAGSVALAAPKGKPWHITAGRVFVICMFASSAIGACMGIVKYDTHLITFFAGILSCYLVLSSWMSTAIRKPAGIRGPAVVFAAVLNAGNLTGLLAAGGLAMASPGGTLFGHPPGNYLFLAAIAMAGAAGDTAVLMRREVGDRHRIARHLWRMCVGFFIAAGSLFTGPGAKVFPQAIQDMGVLSLPEPLILIVMVFWLVRTLRKPGTGATDASRHGPAA